MIRAPFFAGWPLDEYDFPVAQVGNLLVSPKRGTVITCDNVAIARQLASVLNFKAAEEAPERPSRPWLTIQ